MSMTSIIFCAMIRAMPYMQHRRKFSCSFCSIRSQRCELSRKLRSSPHVGWLTDAFQEPRFLVENAVVSMKWRGPIKETCCWSHHQQRSPARGATSVLVSFSGNEFSTSVQGSWRPCTSSRVARTSDNVLPYPGGSIKMSNVSYS